MTTMEVMCLAGGRHLELVSLELTSIASIYGEHIEIVEDPVQVDRYFRVRFRSKEAIVSIISRSVLVQSAHTVVDDQLHPQVAALAQWFEAAYPAFFQSSATANQVAVKSVRKRLRSPKDKATALGRFAAMDTPAFLAAKKVDKCTALTLLIGDKSACLGFLVASGLSPSSGGRGGRIGGGIAATFSLNQRPYTGVTTMDPELAFVMANLARTTKGDTVLDPFAGSCGVLLACAYFGMGLGLAQDVSEPTLRGEGPGRNIQANFDAFQFAWPEISLCDARWSMWRKSWQVDAIVSDPPYGIRTFGTNEPGDAMSGFDDQFVAELVHVWSPHVAPGGRLVFFVCGPSNHRANLVSYLTTAVGGTNLSIIDVIECGVHFMDDSIEAAAWTRSLVVLEKRVAAQNHRVVLPLVPPARLPTIHDQIASRNLSWTDCRNLQPLDIWRAAWLGDIASLETFVSGGGNVNEPDEHGKTALYFAAGYNQVRVVEYLVTVADVDMQDDDEYTALVQAARYGHARVARLLLDAGADPSRMTSKRWYPAYFAATYGHLDVLLALYESCPASITLHGPGHATAIHRAAERGHAVVVDRLIQLCPSFATLRDWMGRTYAAYAARHGHICILELFPIGTSDCDFQGNNPLHEAVRYGRAECVEWLVKTYPSLARVSNHAGDKPRDLSKAPEITTRFTTLE